MIKSLIAYVPCVVDLHNVSDEELDSEWIADRIEYLAKLTASIGTSGDATFSLVEDARSRSVGIRDDSELRYEVPVLVWESGVSIKSWVKSISNAG
mgnify:CR=1 FL=1